MTKLADNPMRKLVCDSLAQGQKNVNLEINPAFASLSAVLLGGIPGDVLLRFTAGPESIQDNGVVSGGVLAAMLDCATAIGALSMLGAGKSCATVSLTVNMLKPVQAGDVQVRAKVDRVGRSVAFVSAQLLNTREDVVATACATLSVINLS